MKSYRLSTALCAALVACCAQAQKYTFVDLHPAWANFSVGQAIANGQQGGMAYDTTGHPTIWSGSLASLLDLTPFPGNYQVNATDGVQQGGYYAYSIPSYYGPRACMWTGTPASFVDLNPSGATFSNISAVGGGKQFGLVYIGSDFNTPHAALWSGTAASMVDIHPAGYDSSYGYGMAGNQQVGFAMAAQPGGGDNPHAMLWQGTAASAVDLHPAAWFYSAAQGTDGTTQGGWVAGADGYGHAAIWRGTADSFIDLSGTFQSSAIYGVGAGKQVGFVNNNYPGYGHAAVWSGTSASLVDLQQFTPTGYDSSYANGIDAQGNIIGVANYVTSGQHACMWVPVKVDMAFQPPVYEDGSSVFKQGSTVPIKLVLKDENGVVISGASVTISVFLIGSTNTAVNESVYETPADNGVLFRASGGQYVYNLGTKGLQKGAQYLIVATANGVSHSVTIGLN